MSLHPPAGHGADPGNVPHRDSLGALWCPFHMYRSAGDNRPTYGAMLTSLNSTIEFALANLSVPGCWSYADMLEVSLITCQ